MKTREEIFQEFQEKYYRWSLSNILSRIAFCHFVSPFIAFFLFAVIYVVIGFPTIIASLVASWLEFSTISSLLESFLIFLFEKMIMKTEGIITIYGKVYLGFWLFGAFFFWRFVITIVEYRLINRFLKNHPEYKKIVTFDDIGLNLKRWPPCPSRRGDVSDNKSSSS